MRETFHTDKAGCPLSFSRAREEGNGNYLMVGESLTMNHRCPGLPRPSWSQQELKCLVGEKDLEMTSSYITLKYLKSVVLLIVEKVQILQFSFPVIKMYY